MPFHLISAISLVCLAHDQCPINVCWVSEGAEVGVINILALEMERCYKYVLKTNFNYKPHPFSSVSYRMPHSCCFLSISGSSHMYFRFPPSFSPSSWGYCSTHRGSVNGFAVPVFIKGRDQTGHWQCQGPRQLSDLSFEAPWGLHLGNLSGIIKEADNGRAFMFPSLLAQITPSSVLCCSSNKPAPPYFQARKPRTQYTRSRQSSPCLLDRLHRILNEKDDLILLLWIIGLEESSDLYILYNLYCKLYIFLASSINIQSRFIF